MTKALALFLGAMTGAFLFLLVAALWLGSPVQELAIIAHGNLVNKPAIPLTPDQTTKLSQLIAAGAVIPAESILQKITDFYTVIINLLISLWAILGVSAYMYIKAGNHEIAKATAEERTDQYIDDFFKSHSFHENLTNICKNQFGDAMNNAVGDFTDFVDNTSSVISNLEKRLESQKRDYDIRLQSLEAFTSQHDTEENAGGDINLSGEGTQ